MRTEQADILLVGGGAAGLTCAIFAAQANPSRRIVILDSAKTLGAKILVSGGGRCNVTHDLVSVDDFHGSRNIIRNVLASFNQQQTVNWFESLGVELKREETGKLFPVSDSARTILNALMNRCKELGVIIRTNHRVLKISNHPPFQIECEGATFNSPRVILCTGGRSLPKTGSDGFGWEIARSLGHTVTPTYAALAPLVLDPSMFHNSLSGIAMQVTIETFARNKLIDRRSGSMLWTHFGISGPVVMDASRFWIIASEQGDEPIMKVNFLPGETFETAEKWLMRLIESRQKSPVARIAFPKISERVMIEILAFLKIDPAVICSQLTRDARRVLTHAITGLILPITQHRGWNYAEVTAGGVPLSEINYRTMESRITPGLHFAGEILDCDGRIGGYNFQWAWASGYLAGRGSGLAASHCNQRLNSGMP